MNLWANCDNCKHDDEDAFDCTECLATRPPSLWEPSENYEPPTNADRIRAMSDEELAKWLADMWDCCYCSEYERTGCHPLFSAEPCDQKCEQHCLEWLKKPYKEDT